MEMNEFNLPEFILGEFPIKTGDHFNDNRHFIVHKGITMIEIIPNEIFIELLKDNAVFKRYKYGDEQFILVYHTNNGYLHNINQYELLDRAWQWYKEYLIWEDNNIDDTKTINN